MLGEKTLTLSTLSEPHSIMPEPEGSGDSNELTTVRSLYQLTPKIAN